jgi:hypothetical protein
MQQVTYKIITQHNKTIAHGIKWESLAGTSVKLLTSVERQEVVR